MNENDREINERLILLYEEMRQQNLPEELSSKLSAPLLVKVSTKWAVSEQRILILGQETFDWQSRGCVSFQDFCNQDDSVKKLMRGYEEFCFSKNYTNSPFWRAFNEVRGIAKKEITFESNVLWSNLVRVDYQSKSILWLNDSEINKITECLSGFLKREIEILKPTAIVSFSGPNYDRFMLKEFGDAKSVMRIDPNISRHELANFAFQNFNILRTYHPNYLSRSKKWQSHMKPIREALGIDK